MKNAVSRLTPALTTSESKGVPKLLVKNRRANQTTDPRNRIAKDPANFCVFDTLLLLVLVVSNMRFSVSYAPKPYLWFVNLRRRLGAQTQPPCDLNAHVYDVL